MVYHFEAQKFLHVCIPQRARREGGERERGGRVQSKRTGDRKEKKGKREEVQREDPGHKVEHQKQ